MLQELEATLQNAEYNRTRLQMQNQAEIDDAMTPSLIATFECTSGSWSMPDFLTNAGLYWLRDDLRRMAGEAFSAAARVRNSRSAQRERCW